MRKTMVPDGQSHSVCLLRAQQQAKLRTTVMSAEIMRAGAAALLVLGVVLSPSGSALALPPGGHPDKCPPSMPDGAFTCVNNGGEVLCTLDGDVMCCTKNAQGGRDCEQIVSFTQPGGKRRPLMRPGTNAPIQRRGVEGEQPNEPAPETSTAPEQPSGTKGQ